MAQRRVEYICILIAAILFYAFCTDFISLFILLNALFLPVMSVVLTCISGLSLEAAIENPDTTQSEVGDELRVYVRVKNPARLGGARVRMNLLINYELEGKVHTEKMRFVTERSEQMTACLVSALHCGRITCRIENLKLYDYLWLLAIPGKASHDRCSFTVMPKLPDIDPLAVPTLREDFESSIYAQNRPGRDYSEVYEIRNYREGDPISSIHHKLSAKREELVVREGSYPVGNRLMLLSVLPDWTGTIEECEEVLTAVFSVSAFLTADGLSHVIAWQDEEQASGLMQMIVNDEASFYEAAACVMESSREPHSQSMDVRSGTVQRLLCFARGRTDAEHILYAVRPDKVGVTAIFTGESEDNSPEIPGMEIIPAAGRDLGEVLSSLVI